MVEQIQKVYKVVERLSDGKLVSPVAYGAAEVIYVPGKWVQAPEWLQKLGYHLTAFINYMDACTFAENLWQARFLEIWLAEAKGILERLPPTKDLASLAYGGLEGEGVGWPKGTIMCKALKLLRKVSLFKHSPPVFVESNLRRSLNAFSTF